jgi:hypothetical protein
MANLLEETICVCRNLFGHVDRRAAVGRWLTTEPPPDEPMEEAVLDDDIVFVSDDDIVFTGFCIIVYRFRFQKSLCGYVCCG